MRFEVQQLIEFGRHTAGIAVLVVLALLAYLVSRRGLNGLLAREYITRPVYVVAKAILRWLLIFVVLVVLLQQLGVKISHILAGLLTVAGMVAIGFIAVWSVLSNILCSLLLILFKTFRIGDEIEVIEPVGGAGLKGRVTRFNVVFTTLAETPEEGGEETMTQVPNNIFFQKSLRRRPGKGTESLGQHLLGRSLPLRTTKKNKQPHP